ncbi:hypothetical protein [Microbispora siamensis]|uniref:hypothetical protein n=1 Tax=Microbispora siamensis TaxID=564413 RepID=UPI00194F9031|nr:hypothetical protein [Microbispora siamensis]
MLSRSPWRSEDGEGIRRTRPPSPVDGSSLLSDLRLALIPEALLAWTMKVTDEYAAWFRTLLKEDLDRNRWYKENIPLAIQLYLDYTSDEEE